MPTLFVGLDPIATLRQAGGGRDPDPAIVAPLAELAGAEGISLSCGRERGGMQERDLKLLRELVRTTLNVYLPPLDLGLKLALAVRPDLVTFVPETRQGLGAERGLDVEDRRAELEPMLAALKAGGISAGVLVDPLPTQIKAAHRAGAGLVLLHTGRLGWTADPAVRAAEFEGLVNAAKVAHRVGLAVHAGGGLTYQSVVPVAQVTEIEAVHVGHSLIARAALVGVGEAVREMLRKLGNGRGR